MAEYVCPRPVNASATSTETDSVTRTIASGSGPPMPGGEWVTVTSNVCSAVPASLIAPTVMVAVPAPTGTIRTR